MCVQAKKASQLAQERADRANGVFEKRKSDVWVCVLCSRSNYWRLKQCRICKRPRVDVSPTAGDGSAKSDSIAESKTAGRRVSPRRRAPRSSAADSADSSPSGASAGADVPAEVNATHSGAILTEFDKAEWMQQTEERIRDELEAEMKEQLHLLVSRYTRSKVGA